MSRKSTEPERRPRVTFCITELDVGGAENALVRIATGLQQNGWDVSVISLRDDGALATPLRNAGIDVFSLNCGSFLDLRCFFRLRAHLKRLPTDVLMCFLHQANIYGRLAARFTKTPVVLSGIRVADRRLSVTIPEKLTRCCVDHYVAVSESVGRTHAEICGISPKHMSAISNGVGVPDDATVERPPKSQREILFVGRLSEQKNPLLLLAAYLQLPEHLRNTLKLTLVGEGPLRSQLQQTILAHGLSDRVELTGHSRNVSKHMKRADVLVLPSRWEGMPNVVLEAMANGLPVIATAVDGTRDIITDGETGWLVQNRSEESLAEALLSVLTYQARAREIASHALKSVRLGHSWENAVNQYDDVFQQLLQRASTQLARD